MDKTKNYPIFWEGKGMGNPQLKKNEKGKNDQGFKDLSQIEGLNRFRRLKDGSTNEDRSRIEGLYDFTDSYHHPLLTTHNSRLTIHH